MGRGIGGVPGKKWSYATHRAMVCSPLAIKYAPCDPKLVSNQKCPEVVAKLSPCYLKVVPKFTLDCQKNLGCPKIFLKYSKIVQKLSPGCLKVDSIFCPKFDLKFSLCCPQVVSKLIQG